MALWCCVAQECVDCSLGATRMHAATMYIAGISTTVPDHPPSPRSPASFIFPKLAAASALPMLCMKAQHTQQRPRMLTKQLVSDNTAVNSKCRKEMQMMMSRQAQRAVLEQLTAARSAQVLPRISSSMPWPRIALPLLATDWHCMYADRSKLRLVPRCVRTGRAASQAVFAAGRTTIHCEGRDTL